MSLPEAACLVLGGLPVVMRGVIRAHHVVTQAPVMIRHFGLRAYVRCVTRMLKDPKQSTFLCAMCAEEGDRVSSPPTSWRVHRTR